MGGCPLVETRRKTLHKFTKKTVFLTPAAGQQDSCHSFASFSAQLRPLLRAATPRRRYTARVRRGLRSRLDRVERRVQCPSDTDPATPPAGHGPIRSDTTPAVQRSFDDGVQGSSDDEP